MSEPKQSEKESPVVDYREEIKGLRRWFYEIALVMSRKSGKVWAGEKWWMKRTGVSRATVSRIINDLWRDGWLDRVDATETHGRCFLVRHLPKWLADGNPWDDLVLPGEDDEPSET
jgi:hypothetical protein